MVDLAAVVSRLVFVIFDVGISHSDGSFHAPTFFQYPLITVGDAGTVDFTVIPVVSQTEHIQVADVCIGIVSVQAEEAAIEPFAEPVTQFGLYEPVFQLLVIRKLPGVVVSRNVEG